MHRIVRRAAGTVAAGVVLVVAAHSAGAAAGTPSTEPPCDLVRQQSREVTARYEADAARAQTFVRRAVHDAEQTGERLTPDQRAEADRLEEQASQRMLQLSAVTLGSPGCFAAEDVELARQSVQQLAPRLAGV